MDAKDVAGTIHALRQALPPERLRFLTPDKGDATDREYLAILLILQEAGRVGSGDLNFDDLATRANEVIEVLRGEELETGVLQSRLNALEAWGVTEKAPEVDESVDLNVWHLDSQRHRISNDGDLILELLESARIRKERPRTTQDASDLLKDMATRLESIRERLQNPEGPREERIDQKRGAYTELGRVVEEQLRSLGDYLKDITKRIQTFGRSPDLDADELDIVLARLEDYMDSVHREFRSMSNRIHRACQELQDPEHMQDLDDGWELARVHDEQELRHTQMRPRPRQYLDQLTTYFDITKDDSLTREIERVRENTRAIISRLRDHYQRLQERRSFVQQIELNWKRLQALDWGDDEAWEQALRWNAGIFEVTDVPTAPNLGDEVEDGQPPTPRRRYVNTERPTRNAIVAQRKQDAQLTLEHEEKIARRLNDIIMKRLLKDRASARLSEFPVDSHEDFRALITITKNSELVLRTPIGKTYFNFHAKRIPDAPRIKWHVDEAEYAAPEIQFTAKKKAAKKVLDV